jgi:hypothetical protein
MVFCHAPGGPLWSAASHAVNLTGLAGPLVLCPARLEIGGKLAAKNQCGALAVTGWQSHLHPGTHGIFMRA